VVSHRKIEVTTLKAPPKKVRRDALVHAIAGRPPSMALQAATGHPKNTAI
jgi:hypothetical protein